MIRYLICARKNRPTASLDGREIWDSTKGKDIEILNIERELAALSRRQAYGLVHQEAWPAAGKAPGWAGALSRQDPPHGSGAEALWGLLEAWGSSGICLRRRGRWWKGASWTDRLGSWERGALGTWEAEGSRPLLPGVEAWAAQRCLCDLWAVVLGAQPTLCLQPMTWPLQGPRKRKRENVRLRGLVSHIEYRTFTQGLG